MQAGEEVKTLEAFNAVMKQLGDDMDKLEKLLSEKVYNFYFIPGIKVSLGARLDCSSLTEVERHVLSDLCNTVLESAETYGGNLYIYYRTEEDADASYAIGLNDARLGDIIALIGLERSVGLVTKLIGKVREEAGNTEKMVEEAQKILEIAREVFKQS